MDARMQVVRRIVSVLVAGALAACGVIAACPRPARATDVATHANLVVVVRFSGDTTGDGQTGYNATYAHNSSYTYWQQFKSWFAPTGIPYFDTGTTSLQSYMATISDGSYVVSSYFPQDDANGSTLTYLTLPHDQAYYENVGDLDLVADAAAAFAMAYPSASGSSWGTNGVLDNLELVVQVSQEPDTSDTLLWPHKSDASGAVSFGGMRVYEYNLVNSKAVADLGTVKHEYLHTAGLGDLYRVGDSSNAAGPVGIWDIMGSAAGQWPLAQSLVDLGFEDKSAITEVSGAGDHTVTLYPHYSSDGAQAVRVASPYSSDEYFVFEYRQKDSGILAPDRLVPSSGLIVYRVNDAVGADSNGHRTNRLHDNGFFEDAIYVFRPGDTGIHASEGDLMRAALSTSAYAYLGDMTNTRTSLGSSDLDLAAFSGTTQSGTIFDSLGRNSGIVVNVTAQSDASITFSLSIPDYSTLDLWDQEGSAATATQADAVSVAAVADGTIYQAYIDAGDTTQSLVARSWSGNAWTSMGTVATGSIGRAQVQAVGSTPYVTYATYPGGSNAVVVSAWDGASWSRVASISTGSSYSNVAASGSVGGSLYVLVDKDSQDAQLYRLDGASLTAVGPALPAGYLTSDVAISSLDGKVAVVCGDVGTSFAQKTGENVYVLDNGSWKSVFREGANTAQQVAAIAEGTSLVTFTGYDTTASVMPAIRVISADGTVTTHEFALAGSAIADAALATSGGKTYLTVVSASPSSSGLTTTWQSSSDDLANWTQLGSATFSSAGTSGLALSTAVSGSKLYAGVAHSSSTSVWLVSHAVASAGTTKKVVRLWGGGALDTMDAIVSAGGFSLGGTAIVATKDGYLDALAASGLAGISGGPVLLTDGSSLSTQTARLLASLKPSTVYVAGGKAVIDDAVLGQIATAADIDGSAVRRLAGAGATDTAVALYEEAIREWSTTCIVATCDSFQDALSIAPYAYAMHAPIFLTSPKSDVLPRNALDAIEGGGFSNVIIVGGTAAVSKDVESQLAGKNITRLAGPGAYDTSLMIATWELANGMRADGMALATGEGYWDALTGAALCGRNSAILVLADDTRQICLDGVVTANAASITTAFVFGGDKVVTPALETRLASIIGA